MKLDADELQQIATALAPQIATALAPLLAERLAQPTAALEYVNRTAAARLAGIGSELWRQVTHELPTYWLGNRVVVRHADLVAWIEARPGRRVQDEQPAPPRGGADEFEQLISAGRLRVVRDGSR